MHTITIHITDGGRPIIGEPATQASTRTVQAGSTIFTSGSEPGYVYVIRTGCVQLSSDTAVRTACAGEIIGEEAILERSYDFTAIAETECSIEAHSVHGLKSSASGGVLSVIIALANTNQKLFGEREAAQVSNLRVRLANLLDQFIEQDGEDMGDGFFRIKAVKHSTLAAMIGAQRSTVSVYISELRAHGLLRDEEDSFLISPEGVRAYLVK